MLGYDVAFDIAKSLYSVYGTAVTLGNRFFSATGSRTLAFGYRRYGRPTHPSDSWASCFVTGGFVAKGFCLPTLAVRAASVLLLTVP